MERLPADFVQGDVRNRSRLRTAVYVPLTSNLQWINARGNVELCSRVTGLPKNPVANVSQTIALYRLTASGSFPQ
jgi:mRNA interferase MazF